MRQKGKYAHSKFILARSLTNFVLRTYKYKIKILKISKLKKSLNTACASFGV